jgi:hypothetical protein
MNQWVLYVCTQFVHFKEDGINEGVLHFHSSYQSPTGPGCWKIVPKVLLLAILYKQRIEIEVDLGSSKSCMKREFDSKLSVDKVCYTNSAIWLWKNMLCSKCHHQTGSSLILFSYKIVAGFIFEHRGRVALRVSTISYISCLFPVAPTFLPRGHKVTRTVHRVATSLCSAFRAIHKPWFAQTPVKKPFIVHAEPITLHLVTYLSFCLHSPIRCIRAHSSTWFCRSQFPHKSVNSFFSIINIKNNLTDLCSNRLLQNDFMDTSCEMMTSGDAAVARVGSRQRGWGLGFAKSGASRGCFEHHAWVLLDDVLHLT